MADKKLNTEGVDLSVFKPKKLNTEGIDLSVFEQPTNDTQVEPIKQSEQANKGLVSTPQQEFLTDEEMQKRAAFEPQLPQESQTKNVQYQQPMTDKTDYMGVFNKKEDYKAANESGVSVSTFDEIKKSAANAEYPVEFIAEANNIKKRLEALPKYFPELAAQLEPLKSQVAKLNPENITDFNQQLDELEQSAFQPSDQPQFGIPNDKWNEYVQNVKFDPTTEAIRMLANDTKKTKKIESIINNNPTDKWGAFESAIKTSNIISGAAGQGVKDYVDEYINLGQTIKGNKAVTKALEKLNTDEPLTTDDKLIIKALGDNAQLHEKIDENIPLSYKIGQGAGYSVPFMLEFALTGGGATSVGKGILKGTAKYATSKIGKFAVNSLVKIAETGVHTPMMPSLYKNTAIDVSKGEDFGKALFNNAWQTAAEVGSERIFMNYLAKGSGTVADKTLRAMGINFNVDKGAVGLIRNIGEEYAEEKVGEIMTAPKDYKNFKEFWNNFTNIENNLVTFGSVAASVGAMGSVAMAGNSIAKARNEAKLARQEKLLPSDVRSEIDVIIDNKDLTVQEQYNLVGELIGDRIDKGELTENPSEVAANAIAYLNYKTQVNSAEATDSSAKIENGEITVGEVEETDLATQQEQLDYLKKQGFEVPDGTTMEKLQKLYDKAKSKITPTEDTPAKVVEFTGEDLKTGEMKLFHQSDKKIPATEVRVDMPHKQWNTALKQIQGFYTSTSKDRVITEKKSFGEITNEYLVDKSAKIANEENPKAIIDDYAKSKHGNNATSEIKYSEDGKVDINVIVDGNVVESVTDQTINDFIHKNYDLYITGQDVVVFNPKVLKDAKKSEIVNKTNTKQDGINGTESGNGNVGNGRIEPDGTAKTEVQERAEMLGQKPEIETAPTSKTEATTDKTEVLTEQVNIPQTETTVKPKAEEIVTEKKTEISETQQQPVINTKTKSETVKDEIGEKSPKTTVFNKVTKAIGLQGKDLVSSLGKTARNGKINGVDVVVQQGENDNEIIIESMRTPSAFRQKGKASKALQTITEQADREGITLKLRAVPQKGSKITPEQLKSFYEKNGFEFEGIEGTRTPNKKGVQNAKEIGTPTKTSGKQTQELDEGTEERLRVRNVTESNRLEAGQKVESDFKQFEDIVKNSKTSDEAFEKISKIKGVSEEVSAKFREKYDPEQKLTPLQAFDKFYNEVKSNEQIVSKQSKSTEDGQKERQGQGRQVLTPTESDITGVKSGDVVEPKVGDSFDYRGHKGIIIKEYPQDEFDKKANYKLYRVEINGKERDLSLENIQRKYPKGKNIESGTPLIDKKNPNSKVWYNGVIFQTDGTPKVVVDYVFNDRGKMMQDEMYIDYESFDERFTPIKSENAAKQAKKEIKEFTDSLPVSLGGLTESEKKEKAKKINEITDKYKIKSESDLTPTEEKKITKEEVAKAKIAEGFSSLADLLGAKKSLTGEQRESAIKAIQKIIEGLIELGIAKGMSLKEAVLNYAKENKFTVPEDLVDEAITQIQPKFTEQYPIGTTNAKVRTSREMRGLDAIPKAERVANKDLWQSVVDKIANGIINPRQTVKDILNTPEVETSEIKEAVVKWDRWRILKETKYTIEEIEAKQQNNDNRELVDLFLRKAELEAELQENDLAAEKLGAAWGKAGQFRQRNLEEDMSLAAIIREAQILNGGKKLTALQEKKFEELSKKFEALQAEYDRLKAESEKKQEQAKAEEEKKRKAAEQKLINDIQNKLAAQTPKPMRDFDTQFKADIKKQKLTEKENTIKERLRDRLGRLANLQFAVGEEGGAMIIEELSGVIKDMSELGIVKLEQGIDRIIAKVKDYMMSVDKKFDGKNLDKYKNEIGKALNIKKVVDDEYERLINKLVEKSQLGFDTGIKGILNDIVYNRVVSGRNTIDDVVDDIYESVKDRIPNITKRKIRDAISGYGEFRKLSKEETDVAVRELKRQGRLDSSIEDVEQNKLPLRTGVERDVQTQETRQKQARILKEIKERDLVPPPTEADQEAQWRSGLQAYKRRLENAIADIEKEIATGERKAKTQPKKYNSPEIESLKTELERLKKVREAIDKESGVYVEQRESAIIKATERAIAELEMDIDKLRQGLATDKNVTVKGNIFGLSKPAKEKIVSDRITELQNLKESLQRELSDLLPNAIKDKALLDKYRKQRERRLEQLKEQQRTKDYGEKPKPYRPPLDKATIEINRAIERLKYDIEKEKEQIRLDNRTWKERLGEGFLNAWSLPKALIASVDLSAPLRQGIVMISKPKTFGKAFAEMFRYAFSKNAYEDWLFDLKGTDDYYEMLENGLYIAEPTAKLAAKEEHFMSNWLRYIDKIPLYGALRAGSERAYIGFLNKLRIDIYRNFRDKLQQQGFTPEEIQKELKSYSHFVNTATGRGKLSVKLGEKEIMNLEGIAPVLNGVFFSPRLIASRLATFNPAFYANMSKETRKDAIKTYLGTTGMIMTTLALVALAYGDDERFEIELDPRSSNFLKIRFNNIYYDLWGGHQQVARTLAQVITGQTKKNGRIQKMTGDKWRGTTRWSTLTNFFMNKVSPTTGTVLGILQGGKTYDGEDMTVMNELINKTVPLYLSDIKEVVEEEGWEFAFITGIPAMFGVGVQTQNRKPKKSGSSGEENEFDYGLEGIEEIDPFGTFDNSGFEESIPDPEQYGTFPEN